jgi:putative CocE/NonD family hydrolase
MGDVDNDSAPGNEWRIADDWPLPYSEMKLFFNENGLLDIESPGDNNPISFTYDPQNYVPTIGGQNLNIKRGPYDQRSVEDRDDVIVFTSNILEDPIEATGPIKAKLFVSSDCPDTDFTVKLTDVYPDGRSMLITDGILRMRNRNGFDHWDFIEPEIIYEITVDLWSTSYIWDKGHKIRVAISSSNYPRFLNNPNTKDPISGNSTYNIAHNTIYIDDEYPSCIILPYIDKSFNQDNKFVYNRNSINMFEKIDFLNRFFYKNY